MLGIFAEDNFKIPSEYLLTIKNNAPVTIKLMTKPPNTSSARARGYLGRGRNENISSIGPRVARGSCVAPDGASRAGRGASWTAKTMTKMPANAFIRGYAMWLIKKR